MKNIKKIHFNIVIVLVLSGILVTYSLLLKQYTISAVVSVFTPIKILAQQADSRPGK